MSARVWLRGGLGNQLFQYSAGLCVSQSLGLDLVIRADLLPLDEDNRGPVSRWPEQISSFDHAGVIQIARSQPPHRTSSLSKALTARRILLTSIPSLGASVGFLHDADQVLRVRERDTPTARRSTDLDGYFLDARIPVSLEGQLRGSLTSIIQPHQMLDDLRAEVRDSVAIHLRLGDHLSLDPDLRKRLVPQLESSLITLRSRYPLSAVSLFTDSAKDAMEIISQAGISNIRTIDTSGLRPIEVLNLLGEAKGLVASASTFAWWAAFLQQNPSRTFFLDTQRFLVWPKLALDGWVSLAGSN